jgi:dodecin
MAAALASSASVFHQGVIKMSVAKVVEIKASSPKSFEHAVQTGIKRASKTLKNVTGAWVSDQEVVVKNGAITEYRVLMKVTFILAK